MKKGIVNTENDKEGIVKTDSTKEKKTQLDWFKAWYPIVQVEILDEEVPHHF